MYQLITYMKIKIFLTIILFFLLLVSVNQCYAQASLPKRGASAIGDAPQTGKLFNAAGYDNVEYNSGTLKVGITLYEIRVNDIRVPISINYSALGIKPGQRPSVVGMGWELNAGGGMVAQINGRPDNGSEGMNYLTGGNPMPSAGIGGALDPVNNSTHRAFLYNAIEGKTDGAWDAYAISTPSGSGSMMRPTGVQLTYPYNPLMKFTDDGLTFGDGLYYNFGSAARRSISKRSFHSKQGPDYAYDDSWVQPYPDYDYEQPVIAISSANHKQKVTFDYFANPPQPAGKISTLMTVPVSRDVYTNNYPFTKTNSFHTREPMLTQTMESVTEKRLAQINFPGGKVSFTYEAPQPYNNNGYALQKMEVMKDNGGGNFSVLKTFIFTYGSKKPGGQYIAGHYLAQIEVYDANLVYAYGWKFGYMSDYLPIGYDQYGIPTNTTKDEYAVDRWGFYNGKITNKHLIENPANMLCLQTKKHYPILGSSGQTATGIPKKSREAQLLFGMGTNDMPFADREFVFNEAVKGTLSSVITPTGERIEYEYEPHTFRHTRWTSLTANTSETRTGGGFRIKSILHKDNLSGKTLLKKIYKYGMGTSETSTDLESGIGMVNYPLTALTTNVLYEYNDALGTATPMQVQDLSLLSHPVNDMTYSGGSYATYGSVAEYVIKDTIGAELTTNQYKTQYFFEPPSRDIIQDYIQGDAEAMAIPTGYINPGVKYDVKLDKPKQIIKYITRKSTVNGSIFFDKASIENFTWDRYSSPSLGSATNAYFGGVNGIKYAYYNSADKFQHCDQVYDSITQQWINVSCSPDPAKPVAVDAYFYMALETESQSTFYPDKYNGQLLNMDGMSNCYKLSWHEKQEYNSNAQVMQISREDYWYGNISHMQPMMVTKTNSMGKNRKVRMRYPNDFPSPAPADASLLISKGMGGTPIETLSIMDIGTNEYILGGSATRYSLDPANLLYNNESYALNTGNKPIVFSAYTGLNDSRYELKQRTTRLNNFEQTAIPASARITTLWDSKRINPLAQFTVPRFNDPTYNSFNDIAFSGFEDEEKGNWQYNSANVGIVASPTGRYAYSLSGGAISKASLNTAITYILSYWSKNGTPVITGGTIGTASVKRTYPGGWTYYEREVTGSSALSISGSGYIDELRLHPISSSVKTFNYDPILGMVSTTDVNGRTVYYEYDPMQRLWQVKDLDGNILTRTIYNLKN